MNEIVGPQVVWENSWAKCLQHALAARIASAFEGPPRYGGGSCGENINTMPRVVRPGGQVSKRVEPSQLPLGARQEHTHASSDSSYADSSDWQAASLVTGHSSDTPDWTWRCSARTVLPQCADSKFSSVYFLVRVCWKRMWSRHAEL